VRIRVPVGLAAPGAFLFGAGLVGPAVFFLTHALGQGAQGEIACRVLARFLDKGHHVVPHRNQVRVKFGLCCRDSFPDRFAYLAQKVVKWLFRADLALRDGVWRMS